MANRRSTLQEEANEADCDLYRVISRLEGLADRLPIAGPKLRAVANKLHAARPALRDLMHPADRERTRGY